MASRARAIACRVGSPHRAWPAMVQPGARVSAPRSPSTTDLGRDPRASSWRLRSRAMTSQSRHQVAAEGALDIPGALFDEPELAPVTLLSLMVMAVGRSDADQRSADQAEVRGARDGDRVETTVRVPPGEALSSLLPQYANPPTTE